MTEFFFPTKISTPARLGVQARGIVPEPASHPNDPLHGVTLETVLRGVVARHGWREMSEHIPIRCFMFDPTIKSSLTFLRKTPWARKRLEDWYVYDAIRDRSISRPNENP